MLIVDDWLEDWLAEHRNAGLEEARALAASVRDAARADGYSLEQLHLAGDGDIDQFVSRVVASRIISESAVAPLEGALGRLEDGTS